MNNKNLKGAKFKELDNNVLGKIQIIKNRLKKIALPSILTAMLITSMAGCSNEPSKDPEDSTKTQTENFYSDWEEDEIVALAKERAPLFKMDEKVYADVIRFLDGEPWENKYVESDFMERGYYTADYNTGLDRKVEAAIGIMSNTDLFDKDLDDITNWVHRSDEFEKGSYENILLQLFEQKIDAVLSDPTNTNKVKDLYKTTVLTFSEEDSTLMIGDIPANQVINNDAGVNTIIIDYIFTAVYPLVAQSLTDEMTIKNDNGEKVLKNAVPKEWLEQEPLGHENTCYDMDDKEQDDDLTYEDDPLNQLMRIQEDTNKLITGKYKIKVRSC